ncbi:MAG: PDZ domain-containing protein [Chloroflexi bacterium]|nr:PDZ domain-containing protein [Chloroflexota bacterium]
MRRRRIGEVLTFTVVAAGFLTAAFFAGYFTHAFLGLPATHLDAPVLAQAHAILVSQYQGQLPDAPQLEYGMIRGMLASVGDPYTVFVEPAPHQLESQRLAGRFGGVGVTFVRNEQRDLVLNVLPGGPAELAGVREGDRLLAVDAIQITPELSLDQIAALIRGPVDSKVQLTARHKKSPDPFTVALTRIAYEIPSVTWRLLDEQATVGVIAVSRFSERTPDEVRAALADLRHRGALAFVLDLRGNGGGLLEASLEVAKLFLDGGVIMHEVQRRGERTVEAGANPAGTAGPLAVLVNGGTASAAEVVAGALSQRGRAPLIGQKTYGKGSVQSIFELRDGSSLHVTSARWYTPDRTPLDGQGLQPTIEAQPAADGTDAEMARALVYFNTGQ